jgi:hypothetical protein
MGRTPRTPPALPGPRPGLVWPVRVDPTGERGPRRWEASTSAWRRSSRGLYLPSSVASEAVDQRLVEIGARLPIHGFLTGWAALRWQGGSWFDGRKANGGPRAVWVNLASGGDLRPWDGVRVTREFVTSEWVGQVDGLRAMSPAWSVAVEMRWARSLTAAVVAIEMALFDDIVSIDEVAAAIDQMWARTGVAQARKALGLAHENSWSPRESETRLVWELEAGLPRPIPNPPIFDLSGRHLGTPDLLLPDVGLAIEYDGQEHLERGRRFVDVRREERFRDCGLESLVVQADDYRDREALVIRMVRAYRRAQRARAQSWTLDAPAWWVRTDTVARRRALPPDRRGRLLDYRTRNGR